MFVPDVSSIVARHTTDFFHASAIFFFHSDKLVLFRAGLATLLWHVLEYASGGEAICFPLASVFAARFRSRRLSNAALSVARVLLVVSPSYPRARRNAMSLESKAASSSSSIRE